MKVKEKSNQDKFYKLNKNKQQHKINLEYWKIFTH